jgi:hypothetical protein
VWVTAIASLLDRSAELKRELLEFSWQPRFDRDRREVLRDRFPDRFVGDALVTENLVDELTYRVHSNMGPSVFRLLEPGGFMIARLVPVGPEWLISGTFACYPKSDRVAIHRIACEMTMRHPKSAFRNPDKLARAQELQSAEHDRFVQFFGADIVVIPGAQLTERMRSFYNFCRDQTVAELAVSGKEPKSAPFRGLEYPADLVASDAVAVTHDEVEGMGLYAEFGPIEQAFADPSLLRHPDYRRRVRDYLDDDTVPPLLFERMAARDPERANQVFRKLLGRKHFDWAIGGEKLMRQRKPDHFHRARLPRIVPLKDKLAPYAAGA